MNEEKQKLGASFYKTFDKHWILRMVYQKLFVIVLILLQLVLFISLSVAFGTVSNAVNIGMYFVSWAVVFAIIASSKLIDYKLTWVVLVLAFPFVGGVLYLVLTTNVFSRNILRRLRRSLEKIEPHRRHRAVVHVALEEERKESNSLANYVSGTACYPLYFGGNCRYLPQGEEMFRTMLYEIEKAEKYIFLEFFIVNNDSMLQELLELLMRKAKQGVEVCFLYDDMGSLFRLPSSFPATLEKMGIQCRRFNHLIPVLSAQFNNRDHRKIVSIDGKTALTGGINIADEYINKKVRFGHWKDSGVVFTGEAAWAMSLMFLELWLASGDEYAIADFPVERYCPRPEYLIDGALTEEDSNQGFIQPYGDSPMDEKFIGQTVYKKMIYNADRYLYITTPYLVLDDDMVESICTAASSGVDVRIITPHIWDKAYVRLMSQSYYEVFLKAGVRIFEYTPGFIHSKILVADDETAVIGTINFDYRSLYLHFEDAVLVYNQPCVRDVRHDFLLTQEKSREMKLDTFYQHPIKKFFAGLLRLFAPLL